MIKKELVFIFIVLIMRKLFISIKVHFFHGRELIEFHENRYSKMFAENRPAIKQVAAFKNSGFRGRDYSGYFRYFKEKQAFGVK